MDMNESMSEYFRLQGEIKALSDQLDSVKANIKLEMRSQNMDKYEDQNGNIATYRTNVRETIDKKRVKELLGELKFSEVVKKTEFETLRVTSKAQIEKLKEMNKN